MNFTKFSIPLLAAIMLVGTSVTPSAAQAETSWWDEPWRFNAKIYSWLPEAPIDIKIDGHDVDNLPESLDNILDSLEMMAMFELEVYKGPIGVFVSPIYYDGKYTEHFTGAAGERRKFTLEERLWLIKYGASYDFGPWPLGEAADFPTVVVQPYVAGLYFHDDLEAKVDPGLLDLGLDYKTTIEFNTLIVGVNTLWDLTERWGLRLGANYGGWDVDHVKETYEGIGTLSYNFKMWDVSSKFFAGYRYLYLDIKKTAEVELKLKVRGPLLGIGWEF
jgi:hypothetical protein